MDPISTAIIAAVVKLGEPAVMDAYQALKALIKKKFGDGKLSRAVEDLEETSKSEGRKVTLGEEVAAAAAADDEELLAAAREVLRLANGPGADHHTHAQGDHSIAVGGNIQGSTLITGNTNRLR